MRNQPLVSQLGPPARPDLEPTMAMEEESGPASPIPVRRYLAFLAKYWWVPLLTLALALAVAGTYASLQPALYVSSGRMYQPEQFQVGGEAGRFLQDLGNFFGTEAELLKSTRLQGQALEALRSSSNSVIPAGAPRVKIQVTQTPKSAIFDVVASGPEPVYTQALLEALMNQYLAFKRNEHREKAGEAEASITEQVNSRETDLKDKERALNGFKGTNDLAVIEEEAKGGAAYLAQLRARLSDYDLERKLLEASTLDQNAGAPASTNVASRVEEALRGLASGSSGVAASTERFAAARELEALKARRDRLGKHLRPKHPKMIQLEAQIEQADHLVEFLRHQNLEQLAALRQAVEMKISDTRALVRELEGQLTIAAGRIAEADRLRHEVERAQSVYDQTKILLERAEIGGKIEQENLSILEHAGPAVHSHKHQIMLLGLAALAGLALGLGIVMVVAARDDRFTSLADVKRQLPERVVGQVPQMVSTTGNGNIPLLEIEDARQPYAESYRNLRSALLFVAPLQEEQPRILLITSAAQEEGKSTISANLARTLAMGGARVLLVDADMRRGALHEMLGLERTPGLTDVLRQPSGLARAIQSQRAPRRPTPRRRRRADEPNGEQADLGSPNPLPNLSFLARGGDVSNPGDLLLSSSVDQLLARLRKQFDYVVIDTCPVFAADDATTLAPKVDGTLLVVRSRHSRFTQVREALDLLHQRQAKVLGLIFNSADASARSYYYYTNPKYHLPAKPPG